MWINKPRVKMVACTVLFSMVYQLLYPLRALALTTGPSQPEVQSFEPVGTTDMVDPFSGDFVYNIPLLDIDGYPINISYHSGIGTEQEASWVGLGWNINPGVANRAVRGIPDDYNGDLIEHTLNIKPEKNVRVGLGGSAELCGWGRKVHISFSIGAGIYINSNNYRGLSAGFKFSPKVDVLGYSSSGANVGVGAGATLNVGSQTGADIDYNLMLTGSTGNTLSRDISMGGSLNSSGGYNTRTGVKDRARTIGVNVSSSFVNKKPVIQGQATSSIPIAVQNYVPFITNGMSAKGFSGCVDLGGEFFGSFEHIYAELSMNKTAYDPNGNRKGYGYLYMQNQGDGDIEDFTRDKDGMFNADMNYLPAGNMTYDVYSLSAQGSGGIFRPFRNDLGFVHDPVVTNYEENTDVGVEVGVGELLEVGADTHTFSTDVYAGGWSGATRDFKKKTLGSPFENVYFKKAGELTELSQSYYNAINKENPVHLDENNQGQLPVVKNDAYTKRDARGDLIYYLTAEEADIPELANSTRYIEDYQDPNGLKNGPSVIKNSIPRYGTSSIRKKDHISEFVQVNKDGSRYVYGIPAMNNVQKEVTFSVENGGATTIDNAEGTVIYEHGDDTKDNGKGQENYYSSTITPAYAHSYLLSNVLSTDFVDVTGNGPTDDDLGKYVKFNYSLKEKDYRWRTPYERGKAQYSAGFNADKKDDKANYIIGSRESWYLHSMETKNSIAEFYVSKRKDALGAVDTIIKDAGSSYLQGAYAPLHFNQLSDSSFSYKLDSIVLYNKQDRFINQGNAVPIKTVIFSYDYSLCPGTTNSNASNGGKLTLNKIYIRYGRSDKNLLSPYQFTYSGTSNPSYNLACKDKWGYYQANNASTPNSEFPYVKQDSATAQYNQTAWQLNKISLPSGGVINVAYEPDDYAFVQDKRVMEMFGVEGVGASPQYTPNAQSLYADEKNPFLYIYYKRKASEYSTDPYKSYLDTSQPVYYSFAVDITGKGAYEQVRGYATVTSMGNCSDGVHGYVKLKPKEPVGFLDKTSLSPITYTGLNMARYYLPQLFYPGSDPDESDLQNIVKGLAYAVVSAFSVLRNPLVSYVKKKQASRYDQSKSFLRLEIPNVKKYGGGSRVKELKISDDWGHMAGADKTTNEFGNRYDYTTQDSEYGTISSGVASYEPMAGGDENPFRTMAGYYRVTKGSSFPPNDPTELFQEEPIGESLYPPAVVGYSKVTVKSIHADKGRSSQTEDVYEYYTAKDFPIRVKNSGIDKFNSDDHGFFSSLIGTKATQGYSIIMNDMHGKPKRTSNYLVKPNNVLELVNSQLYNYFTGADGNLSNNVPVLKYNPSSQKFETDTKVLGEDIDITVDSREKHENTHVLNIQGNLNSFMVGIFYVPIITFYWFNDDHNRYFKGLTTTKVVQQYGILKSVESVKEGAKFIADNLMFNPETGDVLLTKVNNEYRDAEYNTNYPAYWSTRGMGPAYRNISIEDSIQISPCSANMLGGVVNASNLVLQYQLLTSHPENYEIGDELYISYTHDYTNYRLKAWVINFLAAVPIIAFRHPSSTYQTISSNMLASTEKGYCKIMRSGYRNMLSETMQTITSLDNPIVNNQLAFKVDMAISDHSKIFSDSLTELLPWHDTLNYFDTCTYIFGYKGNFRLMSELAYSTVRLYNTNNRKDGVYKIDTAYWNPDPLYNNTTGKTHSYYTSKLFSGWGPNMGSFWLPFYSFSKNNIWGNITENMNFMGTTSSYNNSLGGTYVQTPGDVKSVNYGYNNSLPVTSNVYCGYNHALHESFEDYNLFRYGIISNTSPFYSFFPFSTSSFLSPYKLYSLSTNAVEISSEASHTGVYSLKVKDPNGITVIFSPWGHDLNYIGNIALNPGNPFQKSENEYMFTKAYVFRCWLKNNGASSVNGFTANLYNDTHTNLQTASFTPISNIIDGWQLYEAVLRVIQPESGTFGSGIPYGVTWNPISQTFSSSPNPGNIEVHLPNGWYYDDFRMSPMQAKTKAFVYNPFNQKQIAALDENDLATFYEYDPEGQLIRVNKETERGIITIQESRQANVKTQ